jgi:hypothetical protein
LLKVPFLSKEDHAMLVQKFQRKKARDIARKKQELYGERMTEAIKKRDELKEIAAGLQPELSGKAVARYRSPRHDCDAVSSAPHPRLIPKLLLESL